jgi:hypothetical protein
MDINLDLIRPDPWFKEDPDLNLTVSGLNIACGWPLPKAVQKNYERLYSRLEKIHPDCTYIYPYCQTHITIATLVSFKDYKRPSSEDKAAISSLIPYFERALFSIMNEPKNGFKPFRIIPTGLTLTPEAAYIKFDNASGEIERLRAELRKEIKLLTNKDSPLVSLLSGFRTPGIIHSTPLRIKKPIGIADQEDFIRSFCEATSGIDLGIVEIDEILLTSETKPYMRDGQVLSRYSLKE